MLILHAKSLSRPRLAHGFFGRRGGVSEGIYASLNCGPGSGDDRAKVIENRRRATQALGAQARLLTLYQIHSAKAVTVTQPWETGESPQADGLATAVPGIALGMLTADCAPVLLADVEAGVIGAAHAGWKGALDGIVESTVAAMETLGAARGRIAAAIGPCISQANYEVDGEFRGNFTRADSANARFFVPNCRPGYFRFDLESFAALRLEGAGVTNIEKLSACTYARAGDFYSFRRATHSGEKDYGRELSAIMLTK
ncbi:MAG TPA: peptidoglycan editing factor PgeF [Rhizomicrobium sp.]